MTLRVIEHTIILLKSLQRTFRLTWSRPNSPFSRVQTNTGGLCSLTLAALCCTGMDLSFEDIYFYFHFILQKVNMWPSTMSLNTDQRNWIWSCSMNIHASLLNAHTPLLIQVIVLCIQRKKVLWCCFEPNPWLWWGYVPCIAAAGTRLRSTWSVKSSWCGRFTS